MSGIYVIRRIGTDELYVGSSQNLAERRYRHMRMLRRGEHSSPILQAAWNKYGEAVFEFSVIERCETAMLLEREQHYIDTLNPSFNVALRAGAPMRGRKHTAEWKAAMSSRMAGNQNAAGHTHTAEWREQRSLAMKGKVNASGWKHSDSAKRRIAAAMIGQRRRLGHVASPETRAKLSASLVALWSKRRLEGKYPLATGSI